MINVAYSRAWESLLVALRSTNVSKQAYKDSLEDMVNHLDENLLAVKEELAAEEEIQDE